MILPPSPGCVGSFRKETELPVSHTGGDDVAEESPVSEPWEAPSEAAILLKIESLDSGLDGPLAAWEGPLPHLRNHFNVIPGANSKKACGMPVPQIKFQLSPAQ